MEKISVFNIFKLEFYLRSSTNDRTFEKVFMDRFPSRKNVKYDVGTKMYAMIGVKAKKNTSGSSGCRKGYTTDATNEFITTMYKTAKRFKKTTVSQVPSSLGQKPNRSKCF